MVIIKESKVVYIYINYNFEIFNDCTLFGTSSYLCPSPFINLLQKCSFVNLSSVSAPIYLQICQHPLNARARTLYFDSATKEINIPFQWQKCFDLLIENNIDYFVTKSRSHLVVKSYIEKFEKPYVRLRNFHAKVEVVKESIKEFENWLQK